jgi:ATPase subunit of ABC transporter with duplicated ATPase domains
MLLIQNVMYAHPNKDVLFENISLSLQKGEKTALVGANGTGKSSLLQLILEPSLCKHGFISVDSKPLFIPQNAGQFQEHTVSELLGVHSKLKALKAIEQGDVSQENLDILQDDWLIEERIKLVFQKWNLGEIDFERRLSSLSGGQKTKMLLSGIDISHHDFILMDEPTNHLDLKSRRILYDWIQETSKTILCVSHDRNLLSIMGSIHELSKHGISKYGGNYAFYQQQKKVEREALVRQIDEAQKSLKKAKILERETLERKQKRDARGRKKQEKAGTPLVMMHKMKNDAENSAARLKDDHQEKINQLTDELELLKTQMPALDTIRFGLKASDLYKGKCLFKAEQLQISRNQKALFNQSLDLEILHGERIAIKGNNGSGKSSLIQVILDELDTYSGEVLRSPFSSVYVDQEYSLLYNEKKIGEQAQYFNEKMLPESVIKTRLHQFLFDETTWMKPCANLSGGERMRLTLCCLTLQETAPDCIVLDEPTNNLDIQNVEVLTRVMKHFQGTLIVVSHDEQFLKEIGIQKEVLLGE